MSEEAAFAADVKAELKSCLVVPPGMLRESDFLIKRLMQYKVFSKTDLCYLDEKSINSIANVTAKDLGESDSVMIDVLAAKIGNMLKKSCEEAIEGKNVSTQSAWSSFVTNSENFFGGTTSAKVNPDQSLVHLITKNVCVFKELRLSGDGTTTSELKPAENHKGEIVLTRQVAAGKQPQTFAELVAVVIPWLVAVQSEVKMRKGALCEEYLARLAAISRKRGDLAAIKFDSVFRCNLNENSRRLAAEKGISLSEACLRWIISGNDEEAKTDSYDVSNQGAWKRAESNYMATTVQKCQYLREDCPRLQARSCPYKPFQHASRADVGRPRQQRRPYDGWDWWKKDGARTTSDPAAGENT
jgi:hypothetical protein